VKNRLGKFFIFILIVISLDSFIGFFCKKLYYKSKDFTIAKLRYTLDSTKEDILILGSSRAEHHFVPKIIKENLGLSVYNCGIGGEDLDFSLIQLYESLKRYKPKVIIAEVSPSSLSLPNPKENLKVLLPYYKKSPLIFNALTNNAPLEKLKFISTIYPFNSTISSLLKGIFKHPSDSLNGLLPLYGNIDTNGLANKIYAGLPSAFPSEKFNNLKQLISLCQHESLPLFIVNSPVYLTNSNYDAISNQIENICLVSKNVRYLNYSNCNLVYNQISFFKDHTHLNYQGAKIFSEVLSKDLKKYCSLYSSF